MLGREIQKYYKMEPQVAVTFPLLIGTEGKKKMSQSYNNYISLSDSPENIFGKIMSLPDNVMWEYFLMLTDLDIKDGYKWRNVPLNHRLKYLMIGKKCLKFSYLADSDSFRVEFPKATRTLLKNLYAKNFEDFEQKGDINE